MNPAYRTSINTSPRADPFDQWLAQKPDDPRQLNAWFRQCPEPEMLRPLAPPPPSPKPPTDVHKELRQEIEGLRREVRELSSALEAVRAECWGWVAETCTATGEITGRETA